MTFLEKRLQEKRDKRNYRLKVLVLILILVSIVAAFYFTTAGKGIKYKKQKTYDDWTTFQKKDKRK